VVSSELEGKTGSEARGATLGNMWQFSSRRREFIKLTELAGCQDLTVPEKAGDRRRERPTGMFVRKD